MDNSAGRQQETIPLEMVLRKFLVCSMGSCGVGTWPVFLSVRFLSARQKAVAIVAAVGGGYIPGLHTGSSADQFLLLELRGGAS